MEIKGRCLFASKPVPQRAELHDVKGPTSSLSSCAALPRVALEAKRELYFVTSQLPDAKVMQPFSTKNHPGQSVNTTQTSKGQPGRVRRGWARPRFAVGASALAIAGATWAALAAPFAPHPHTEPVPMAASSASRATASPATGGASSSSDKPVKLSDLPGVAAQYGQMRRLASLKKHTYITSKSGSHTSALVGSGTNGFNLTEVDLTPNTASDEREIAVSPDGSVIAFRSNGLDSNSDGKIDAIQPNGKFHIWIMNADGANQRQVTGLNTTLNGTTGDNIRNQFHPSWSPDGNQLVYADQDPADPANTTQLWVVSPLNGGTPEQRTNFPGRKEAPAWSPNGAVFAFSSNYNANTGAALPSRSIFTVDPAGSLISFTQLTNGSDDSNPAWGQGTNNSTTLYFSSNRDTATAGNLVNGRRIWQITANGGLTQLTDPMQRISGTVDDRDDYPVVSRVGFSNNGDTIFAQLGFQSNSFIDNTDATHDFNVWGVRNAGGSFREAQGSAQVITNILSSPQSFTSSGLPTPPGEDKANDGESAFARTSTQVTTQSAVARLYFVSGRQYAPNATKTRSNPFGGNGVNSADLNDGTSHDIWTTTTQDTTPPALIPQAGAGGGTALYPVVAPRADSPVPAPRTYEDGLRPGGTVRFGVVLSDTESGIDPTGVSISVFNADAPTFNTDTDVPVNDNIVTDLSRETKARIVNSYTLTSYDDGPPKADGTGGHEQEANAVAGDGNFYCETTFTAPASGDYYIDVITTDRAGNGLTYDNIWGFSTRRFSRSASDLFVSDYTCGQNFQQIKGRRFLAMIPVESYYLNNPSAPIADGNNRDKTTGVPAPINAGPSTPTSFSNVDIWRVLCRGAVPASVMNLYLPTTVMQIDPTTPYPIVTPGPGVTPTPEPTVGPNATPTATPLPFTQLTRKVLVAKSSIIWASPYAGTTFAGPGTILDAQTQANLSSFLSFGGRLFISGRDVAWALSGLGTGAANTFLNNDLGAKFAGENSVRYATATANGLLRTDNFPFFYYGDLANLQFPRLDLDPKVNPNHENDAAGEDGPIPPYVTNSNISYGSGNFDVDSLTANPVGGATVLPAYTANGATIGQRVERLRSSNAAQDNTSSRVVFYSFGFEAINRRYRRPAMNDQDGRFVLNTRSAMASFILTYFKTITISGTVINRDTNQPVPNFLVRVDAAGGPYFVRSNAAGTYIIDGIPTNSVANYSGYGVSAYTDKNGITSPSGYIYIGTTNNNVIVAPATPGSISGKAISSNDATTNDPGNASPINRLPVLLRTTASSPLFAASGFYYQLVFTDVSGNFSFAGVPALATVELVFNPTQADVDAADKNGANLTYDATTQRLTNYGRRVIPDGKRSAPLVVPNGSPYQVDDIAADTAANENKPIVIPRAVASTTLTGRVLLQAVDGTVAPLSGASVVLLDQANTQIGTATSGSDGTYTFGAVPAGTYTVQATYQGMSATATVTVAATPPATTPVPDITIAAPGTTPTATPTPVGPTPTPTPVTPGGSGPTFVTGRSYAVSFPYETSPNANSRNLLDRSDADATIAVTDAFNYAPTEVAADGSTTRLYSLSRFDINTLTYIQLADDALLNRGEGYLLTVSALPQNRLGLQAMTTLENGALQALNADPAKNQFTVTLGVNASLNTNTLAGNNFIGFGFDPTQFSSVTWDTTTADPNASSVTVTDGTKTYSLAQAVGNAPIDKLGTRISLMAPSLTTIDANGAASSVTSLTPFGGYFVVAKKDGLRLTFKNPTTTINVGSVFGPNVTVGFSVPFGPVKVRDAFTATSVGYKVYRFDVTGQKGSRNLTTGGSDLIQIGLDDVLQRGVGYIIMTGSTSVALNTALPSGTETTFDIPLTRNAAFPGGTRASARNGYNLIGSPFNPLFNSPSFETVTVKAIVGKKIGSGSGLKTYTSLQAAAAAGVISNRLYTTDAQGNLIAVAMNDRFLRPYRAYYVQVFKDTVTLTLTSTPR
jgi:Tol biopolymer transport system component